jgi:hypothetical protein
MRTKRLSIAAIFTLLTMLAPWKGTLGTAGAQSTNTGKPYPPGFLLNMVKQMQAAGQTTRMGPVTSGGESNSANVAPGFYQFHATNCVSIVFSPTTVAACVFSQEGEVICAINPTSAFTLPYGASCVNGNLLGVNVVDSAGDVNLVISYPTK